ncbi:MAG TPA: redoxin domain-containing protein, partial [Polyangiaceae bacterium]|nr:redoxin domain-containing protein [Polyangiaceae bacterium]
MKLDNTMAVMVSSQLPLGSLLPKFALMDTMSQAVVRTEDYAGRSLLVAIICNHCPYVAHIKQGLAQLADKLAQKGIPTLAVSANDPRLSPIDAPEKMALDARI